MSSPTIDIRANTGPAQKELQNFGKQISGLARVWENIMGGKGSRESGANLQQMSRGMGEFAKSADAAAKRLQAINDLMTKTSRTRMTLVDSNGKVEKQNRAQYESLLEQEKTLAEQQKRWTAIARIRSQMAENDGPAPSGPPGLGRFGSVLGDFANTTSKGLLGPLARLGIGAAIGGMVVTAIHESMESQKEAADFLPRMFPGSAGGLDAFGMTKRMRGVGKDFGFNSRESLAVFGSMSEGGSSFGGGALDRDARAAMQFGRMFGIDAAGEGAMLATAQRSGAFKAGDAKKFAGMLATEIARTGLGPRAQEVQEATLMLLNQQMQTNPRANAAPLMALQTVLNKTGVPAFQGTSGASFIGQLQQGITNPNSEGTEALLMQAAQKAGVHTLFGFEMFKGQGLNNAKTLPAILQTILEGSHGNGQIAQMTLQQGFNLPLPKVHALFQATHGFRDLSSGAIQSAMKGLQGQEGFLDKGAAGAMSLPGNQLRVVEAHFHDRLMAAGDRAAQKLIKLATSADEAANTLESLASGGKAAQRALDQWSHRHLGTSPGAISGPMGRFQDRLESGMNSKGNPYVKVNGQLIDPDTGAPPVGAKWHKGMFLPNGTRVRPRVHFEGMGAAPFHASGAADHVGKYLPNGKRRRGPKGSPTNPAPVLPPVGNIEPYSTAKGSFETYDEGGGRGQVVTTGGHQTLHVVIEERGVVGEASKQALRRFLYDAIDERTHHRTRSHTNTRNMRR